MSGMPVQNLKRKAKATPKYQELNCDTSSFPVATTYLGTRRSSPTAGLSESLCKSSADLGSSCDSVALNCAHSFALLLLLAMFACRSTATWSSMFDETLTSSCSA